MHHLSLQNPIKKVPDKNKEKRKNPPDKIFLLLMEFQHIYNTDMHLIINRKIKKNYGLISMITL